MKLLNDEIVRLPHKLRLVRILTGPTQRSQYQHLAAGSDRTTLHNQALKVVTNILETVAHQKRKANMKVRSHSGVGKVTDSASIRQAVLSCQRLRKECGKEVGSTKNEVCQ